MGSVVVGGGRLGQPGVRQGGQPGQRQKDRDWNSGQNPGSGQQGGGRDQNR